MPQASIVTMPTLLHEVYISSLDPSVTNIELQELFGKAGGIAGLQIHTRKAQKSFAFVAYAQEEEARRATEVVATNDGKPVLVYESRKKGCEELCKAREPQLYLDANSDASINSLLSFIRGQSDIVKAVESSLSGVEPFVASSIFVQEDKSIEEPPAPTLEQERKEAQEKMKEDVMASCPKFKKLLEAVSARLPGVLQTPAGILQTYIQKFALKLEQDTGTESPTGPFTHNMKVIDGHFKIAEAEGKAHTKKEAKHMCAVVVLEKLLESVPVSNFITGKDPENVRKTITKGGGAPRPLAPRPKTTIPPPKRGRGTSGRSASYLGGSSGRGDLGGKYNGTGGGRGFRSGRSEPGRMDERLHSPQGPLLRGRSQFWSPPRDPRRRGGSDRPYPEWGPPRPLSPFQARDTRFLYGASAGAVDYGPGLAGQGLGPLPAEWQRGRPGSPVVSYGWSNGSGGVGSAPMDRYGGPHAAGGGMHPAEVQGSYNAIPVTVTQLPTGALQVLLTQPGVPAAGYGAPAGTATGFADGAGAANGYGAGAGSASGYGANGSMAGSYGAGAGSMSGYGAGAGTGSGYGAGASIVSGYGAGSSTPGYIAGPLAASSYSAGATTAIDYRVSAAPLAAGHGAGSVAAGGYGASAGYQGASGAYRTDFGAGREAGGSAGYYGEQGREWDELRTLPAAQADRPHPPADGSYPATGRSYVPQSGYAAADESYQGGGSFGGSYYGLGGQTGLAVERSNTPADSSYQASNRGYPAAGGGSYMPADQSYVPPKEDPYPASGSAYPPANQSYQSQGGSGAYYGSQRRY